MTHNPFDLETWMTQMAHLIELPIPTEYQDGVLDNLERIQTIAQLVLEFPLPEDIQLAPTFEP